VKSAMNAHKAANVTELLRAWGGGDQRAFELSALDALLGIEGDDAALAEAQGLTAGIPRALPNDTIRRHFTDSEIVRRLRHY